MNRDPAARHYLEILFTYSGFHATFIHRISNLLWRFKLKFIARALSSISRILTSIEIHPAAKIDEGFFIDHGAGLVIGETTIIGKNVTIYQQTTLGGLSPSIDSDSQRNIKRHPTIRDNVIVGSGAQILGPVVIGKNSRIGANAVVLKDVPENITYVGVPARKIESRNLNESFNPYGISGQRSNFTIAPVVGTDNFGNDNAATVGRSSPGNLVFKLGGPSSSTNPVTDSYYSPQDEKTG